jgi:hypothetical protein
VRIALQGVKAVFHRPHPEKETDKGSVVSLRRFLTEAGAIEEAEDDDKEEDLEDDEVQKL